MLLAWLQRLVLLVLLLLNRIRGGLQLLLAWPALPAAGHGPNCYRLQISGLHNAMAASMLVVELGISIDNFLPLLTRRLAGPHTCQRPWSALNSCCRRP